MVYKPIYCYYHYYKFIVIKQKYFLVYKCVIYLFKDFKLNTKSN